MKYYIIVILTILFSCKSDDCDPTVNNSSNSNNLIEVDYFGFRNTDSEGIDCDLIIVSTQDSFKTLQRFALDSFPININTDSDYGYKGILKLLDKTTVCKNQLADPPFDEEYRYAQILYWELL